MVLISEATAHTLRDYTYERLHYFFLLFPYISRDCVRFASLCETKCQNAAPENVVLGARAPIAPPCYATG